MVECQICGKTLVKGQKKFCSRDCFGKFRKTGKTVKCGYCGKNNYVKSYLFKDHEHHFCGSSCKQSFFSRRTKDIKFGVVKRMYYKEGKTQKEIGKYFHVNRDEVRKFMRRHNLKPHDATFKKGLTPPFKGKKGIHLSPKTEFKKGLVPWNKGLSKKNDKRLNFNRPTKFKKGHKHITLSQKSLKRIGKLNSKNMKLYFKNNPKYREKNRLMLLKIKKPNKNTTPEIKTFKWLKDHHIKFQDHKQRFGICQPDAFIKPNISIFVDGDYWHGNPKKYKFDDLDYRQRKNWEKDRKQEKKMKQEGEKIIRIWEDEINKNNFSKLNFLTNVHQSKF